MRPRQATAEWQRGDVEIATINPDEDERGLADWFGIWRATDLEKFADDVGWDEQDIRAQSHDTTTVMRHLLARADDGSAVAAALFSLPQLDNLHAAWLDVRVDPSQRRLGYGRTMVQYVEAETRRVGRTVINGINDMPVAQQDSHPAPLFCRAMAFEVQHMGHRRALGLPLPPERAAALWRDVRDAKGASDYRVIRLKGRWPDQFVEDQCALERAMSTDQPLGDSQATEEVWDAARIDDQAQHLADQGLISLVAAAQHIESGQLVACSRLVYSDRRPSEAWQWATIVLEEHRGHRLGLAVKLANLDFLAQELPTARRVITSNAAVNAPMIAVNDLMGFEIDAIGAFWQKTLT
jgi:GNAT superfamily N-acetyltransferase